MKNIKYFYCLIIGILFVVSSCDDDDNKGTVPSAPTEVTATSDNGEVVLKWKVPTDESFAYVRVSYINSSGTEIVKNISKYAADDLGYASFIADGFTDAQEYSFKLASYNLEGGSSSAVEVKASPMLPIYNTILPTVGLKTDFGGGIITWSNPSGKKAFINISYPKPSNPSVLEKISFDASKAETGSLFGLPPEQITLTITVSDTYENESEAKNITFTPLEESEIDRSGWTVPGFNPDSWEPTIGYSSQATNEGKPNGLVMAMFDNSTATYWHTSWGPSTKLPQWVIVDMGKEVTISRVVLTKRINNTKGQKGHQFLTCTNAGAVNKEDPTTWSWVDQGEYSFVVNDNNPQSYRLLTNPKARYLQVYFAEKFTGTETYVMLSELKVFGQE